MIVGFTGSQKGMTISQFQKFLEIAQDLIEDSPDSIEFHHGDCVGSDLEAHEVMSAQPGVQIVVHPPDKSNKRAFCNGNNVLVLPEAPYLERDMDIARIVDVMIATPDTMKEKRRSGTWATIRYAKKLEKPLYIIHPDGSVIRYVGE